MLTSLPQSESSLCPGVLHVSCYPTAGDARVQCGDGSGRKSLDRTSFLGPSQSRSSTSWDFADTLRAQRRYQCRCRCAHLCGRLRKYSTPRRTTERLKKRKKIGQDHRFREQKYCKRTFSSRVHRVRGGSRTSPRVKSPCTPQIM